MITAARTFLLIVLLALAASAPLCAQPAEEDRRYTLAEGYERSGDNRNAARVYRELFDADPHSNIYFEGVRRTYSALGQYAELLPLVAARVEAQPNDYELRVAHADLLFRLVRRDEARAEWRKAIEIGNHQEFVYAIVAQSQTENRDYDAAIETYRAGRDRSGDRLLFADQLSHLFVSVGRYDDATRELLATLGAMPERIALVKRAMAPIVVNPTGLSAATTVLEQAIARNADFEPYLDLLSWLYDEAGNHDGALEIAKRLDHVRGSRGSNIYAYADRALRERRYDAALAALDYFIATYGRDNPLHPIALLTYARALEERHRAGGAADAGAGAASLVERYRDLAEREQGSEIAAEALLRAARLQSDELDDPDAALETLEEVIAAPSSARVLPDALLLLGDLRLRDGSLDDAEAAYARAAAAAAAEEEREVADLARLRRAELALYRQRFKAAVDSLTELTRETSSAVTNDALGYLFILQENFERNDSALGEYMTGRLKVVQHRWSDAQRHFEAAARLAPGSSLAEEATLARASAQSSAGDHAEAVDALVAFVDGSRDALRADRALFRAAEIVETHLRDPGRALELYTRLLTDYPRSQHAAAARNRIRTLRNG